MRVLAALPLMLVVIIAYNAVVFGNPGGLDAIVFAVPMISGADVAFTGGNLLIAAGLVMLFIEVLKAARASNGTIVDHILSTLVFSGALVEFLLVRLAGTATFALIVGLCLLDVLAGFSVSIRTSRRDVSIGNGRGFD